MLVAMDPRLMIFGMRDAFSDCEVHSQRIFLSTSLVLFLNNHLSLILLKAVLNGLKQASSSG